MTDWPREVRSVRAKDVGLTRTPNSDDGRSAVARGMAIASQISGLGLELALPMFAGYWLDQRWGTTPWLFLAGVLLGIYIFSMGVYRLSKDMGQKS